MNTYTIEFFAPCPANGVRIKYHLSICKKMILPVESILAAVSLIEAAEPLFHEEIADQMFAQFGGRQMIIAEHHGVRIETLRRADGSLQD